MGLTGGEWEKVEALLPDALALTGPEREAFLIRHCGSNAAMRAELESLLAASDRAGGFLAHSVSVSLSQPASGALPAGTPLGAWRIDEPIGRGGMGEVYAAERADGQFEMHAALKVLKRGLDTDGLLRRFMRERNILTAVGFAAAPSPQLL
jgi:serine/threonine protein kinase